MRTIKILLNIIYKSFGVILFSFVLFIFSNVSNGADNVIESKPEINHWKSVEFEDEMTDKIIKYN